MPSVLTQRTETLRLRAEADDRIEGVLLYGSQTTGEADEFSDIEAYLFVDDAAFADFDLSAFLHTVAPLRLSYVNQYGVRAVIFDDLMRGEFHPERASGVDQVRGWRGMIHLPDPQQAVLLDRTGWLSAAAATLAEPHRPDPASTARTLVDELTNWTLLVANLLARGERARAQAFLTGTVAPCQLKLCRLLRDSVDHWLTPSRRLEHDLPAADLDRYAATIAALPGIPNAARASWEWTRTLAADADERWELGLDSALLDAVGARLPESSATQRVSLVTLVVNDYDAAIDFHTRVLGWDLVSDTRLDAHKRWVVVRPPGSEGTAVLLARAADQRQRERIGDQTGGRVGFFLSTDDVSRDYRALTAAGVQFEETPRQEPYGTVAVFTDSCGNRWDLIEPQ